MRKIITKAIALLIAFSTATLAQEKGSFTDPRDKKKYKTVKIGEQVWMAENLSFNADGSKCYGEDGVMNSNWDVDKLSKAQIQAYCTQYGRFYNWETALKTCPTGWHLPSYVEWRKLLNFVSDDGTKLKSKSGWKTSDGKPANGTDNFGFSALPGGNGGGYSGVVNGNASSGVGSNGDWWGATEVPSRADKRIMHGFLFSISTESNRISMSYTGNKAELHSIRCIQGDEEELAKAETKAKAEAEAYVKANGGTFTDTRDKKTYKTIKINGQIWLAENLSYAAENTKCYDNKPENCTQYGRLYNWETAMKSCPAGWHLPKDAEWDKLYRSADGTSGTESPYSSETAGIFLKVANNNSVDKFGFSALLGGLSLNGGYQRVGEEGHWWSASEENKYNAYERIIWSKYEVANYNKDEKSKFFSVRCIKD